MAKKPEKDRTLADDIYANLPEEARFVPYSAKAARKRKAAITEAQPALFEKPRRFIT